MLTTVLNGCAVLLEVRTAAKCHRRSHGKLRDGGVGSISEYSNTPSKRSAVWHHTNARLIGADAAVFWSVCLNRRSRSTVSSGNRFFDRSLLRPLLAHLRPWLSNPR